jgi:SAM-dependent methyltransferase
VAPSLSPMSLTELQRAWNDLGELDPFWAITGDPRRKFARWDADEFLATGELAVGGLMSTAAELGRPRGRESVLDFGCGMGRLARAFRSRFDRYCGVDISESLVREARAINSTLSSCEFLVRCAPDLAAFSDGAFDLVYSFAVLQHVPSRALSRSYIAELLRVVKPDGLLAFQAFSDIRPLYRLQPRRRLYPALRRLGVPERVLYEKLRLYPNQAHFIPEREVVAVVHAAGARVLRLESDSEPGAPHRSTMYYVARG